MVEGKKVEPVGSGIVPLVLRVVAFDSERTCKFAKVHVETLSDRNDVRTVGLKDIAINVGARFIRGIPLRRVGGLSELQIQAAAPSASSGHIRWMVKNHASLIQIEVVTEDVVSTQHVHPANRVVEVVFIIGVNTHIDRGIPNKVESLSVLGGHQWLGRRRHLLGCSLALNAFGDGDRVPISSRNTARSL